MTLEINGEVDNQGIRCLKSLMSDGLVESAWYGEETLSTNTSAIEDLRRGSMRADQLPRIYVADSQTGGRGRQGRTWISDKQNLAFTVAVRTAPSESSWLGLQSIAVGVAIAEAIEHEFAPVKAKLKWPNDVWIDGGKFGGILIERISSVADCMVVGVGLNVGSAPLSDELASDGLAPEDLSHRVGARSLANCLGRVVNKWDVLDAVVRRLTDVRDELQNDPSAVIMSFRQRCLLTDKKISFQLGGETRTGICKGIDELGQLMVERGGQSYEIASGEASLVRIQPR